MYTYTELKSRAVELLRQALITCGNGRNWARARSNCAGAFLQRTKQPDRTGGIHPRRMETERIFAAYRLAPGQSPPVSGICSIRADGGCVYTI